MLSELSRIVVVDDDPDMRDLMVDVLSMQGYQVLTWHGARDAHACIYQAMPALVIVDLNMEHWAAGLDVLSELHADPMTASIPAILYSSALHTLDGQRESLQAAGVRLLQKPFGLKDLIPLIEAALAI